MWYGVAFLLCAGSLTAGYLAMVARRWPSDEQPAQLLQQRLVDQYPGLTGDVLGRMMRLANPVTRRGRARPLGLAAVVMAVLAVASFLIA
jgi:hypothetical protein